jgi:hypothetical protein
MGLDLTLLPFDGDIPHVELFFSHTLLSCGRRQALFEAILALETLPVPANFTSFYSRDDAYEEPHYGVTTTDAYGCAVRMVTAEALGALQQHPGVQAYPKNQAIWAYLAALPPATKVALYWH